MTRYLLLLAAAVSAPTGARTVDQVPYVSVPVSSVRLDNPRAVSALRQRIDRAARSVCEPNVRMLSARVQSESCREQASVRANQQLDALIARHRPATAMLTR